MSFNCKSKDGKSYSINWVKVKDAYVPSSVVCSQKLNINLQKKPKDKLPKCPAGLVCKETLDPNSVLKIGNYNLTLSNYFDTNHPVYKYSLKNYKENATFRIPGNQNFALRVTPQALTIHPISKGSLIPFKNKEINITANIKSNISTLEIPSPTGYFEELPRWEFPSLPPIPDLLPPDWYIGMANILYPTCPCTSVGVGGNDSWCNDPECCEEILDMRYDPVEVLVDMGITTITRLVCPNELDPPEAVPCPVVPKENIAHVDEFGRIIPSGSSKCYCSTGGDYPAYCSDGGCVCVSCEECNTKPRDCTLCVYQTEDDCGNWMWNWEISLSQTECETLHNSTWYTGDSLRTIPSYTYDNSYNCDNPQEAGPFIVDPCSGEIVPPPPPPPTGGGD